MSELIEHFNRPAVSWVMGLSKEICNNHKQAISNYSITLFFGISLNFSSFMAIEIHNLDEKDYVITIMAKQH